MKHRIGVSSLIGFAIIIMLSIGIVAGYLYLDSAKNKYYLSVERAVRLIGQKYKERLDVSINNISNNILVENKWSQQSTIEYIVFVNRLGNVSTYKLNLTVSPYSYKKLSIPLTLSNYKSIYLITSLGNVFTPINSTQSTIENSQFNAYPQNITFLRDLANIRATELDIIGVEIAKLYITDQFGNGYLYIFNITDGTILAVNKVVKKNKKVVDIKKFFRH